MLPTDSALLVGPGHRRPHLREFGKLETRRHDARHQITLAIQVDVLANNGRVGSKVSLPEPMAKYDNIGPTGLIFLGRKRPAQPGLNSQGREEAGRNSTC